MFLVGNIMKYIFKLVGDIEILQYVMYNSKIVR